MKCEHRGCSYSMYGLSCSSLDGCLNHGAYLLSDFFFESAGGAYVGFVHGLVVLVSLFGSPWGWVSC